MAPKGAKLGDAYLLKDVVPTQSEIEAARKILQGADIKAQKSHMACMAAYAKRTGQDDAVNSRGEDRATYLERYLVAQLRKKGHVGRTTNVKEVETDQSNITDVKWMAMEEMDTTFGKLKGATFRESGKLKTRPDEITGSTEPHMLEYEIPRNWFRKQESERDKMSISSDAAVGKDDMEHLQSLQHNATQQCEQSIDVHVKSEQLSHDEDMAERVSTFMNNKRAEALKVMSRLNDYMIEMKVLIPMAADTRYCAELCNDAKNQNNKLKKAMAMAEKIFAEAPLNVADGVPKFLLLIDGLAKDQEGMLKWASKFGLSVGLEQKTKRRKGAKEQ